jgi:hypothetical protein
MSAARTGVRLTDDRDGHVRTTRSLVASLAARLGTLGYVTGGEAVGSHLAGIAALGREVGRTAEGQRLRQALLSGRAAGNGEALWSALKIGDWLSQMPPSPLLDELRNDLALLLADDLDPVLQSPPGSAAVPTATLSEPQPVSFLDTLLGLWAWGTELAAAVEALAAPSMAPAFRVDPAADGPSVDDGPMLR